jgi:hypothetical protein
MNFWLARRTLHLFSTFDALGKARITKLTDRALLILQGPDARKYYLIESGYFKD